MQRFSQAAVGLHDVLPSAELSARQNHGFPDSLNPARPKLETTSDWRRRGCRGHGVDSDTGSAESSHPVVVNRDDLGSCRVYVDNSGRAAGRLLRRELCSRVGITSKFLLGCSAWSSTSSFTVGNWTVQTGERQRHLCARRSCLQVVFACLRQAVISFASWRSRDALCDCDVSRCNDSFFNFFSFFFSSLSPDRLRLQRTQ